MLGKLGAGSIEGSLLLSLNLPLRAAAMQASCCACLDAMLLYPGSFSRMLLFDVQPVDGELGCLPSCCAQAGAGDASSVTSDSSGQEQSSKQLTARLGQATGNVDVHAAKQAALSALAGLDMTTTKANLDASKAAAATARANGEIPAHPRKSNLRSASCRQLGSSSTATSGTPTAVKSVAFDDTAKSRPPADGARAGQGQWRGPATTFTAADGQPRRANRCAASASM